MMKRQIKDLIKSIIAVFEIVWWIIQPPKKTTKTVAFLFRVSRWKHPYMKPFLNGYEIRFVPFGKSMKLLKWELNKYEDKVFIIWGYNESEEVTKYAVENNIPYYRMEDGFVRSVGLGSMHTPPYSLCIDKQGMYFDSSQPSDLEDILNHYNFSENKELLNQAKRSIEKLNRLGISKYNHVEQKSIDEIYGVKKKKRILVIGQVEDDASILKGSKIKWTNNELVLLAKEENPEAEIFYKPHPDVLAGKREKQSNPKDIMHIAKVIEEPLSLVDSFKTIDHVYTITSLAGFEALIRGISVTTVGAPFYSNWGLTDDRQIIKRRKRKLTKEELFAGAYILYPKYVNPTNGEEINLEETIDLLSKYK